MSGLKQTMTPLASKARSDSYLILDRSLVATSTRFDFYYNCIQFFHLPHVSNSYAHIPSFSFLKFGSFEYLKQFYSSWLHIKRRE